MKTMLLLLAMCLPSLTLATTIAPTPLEERDGRWPIVLPEQARA